MNYALIDTFRQSGIVGKLIIVFLLGLSVYAWYIILDKFLLLRAAARSSHSFLQKFRKERERIFSLRFPADLGSVCPLYNVYEAGVREIEQLDLHEGNPGLSPRQIEGVENALSRAVSTETMSMEKMLIVLAITATISPLMGLLGTVWGIMNAFRGMAGAGSASIGTVAPGISEALITTVVGLLVAIPALAGYNVILSRIRHLSAEMSNFASEFVSIVGRMGVGH